MSEKKDVYKIEALTNEDKCDMVVVKVEGVTIILDSINEIEKAKGILDILETEVNNSRETERAYSKLVTDTLLKYMDKDKKEVDIFQLEPWG